MKLLRPILLGGLVAGTLDILYAFIHYGLAFGVSPVHICQSVAAGWIGRPAAFAGGLPVAALGLASHYLIATLFAAFFVLCATRIPAIVMRPFITGPVYGGGLYFVMNYAVVPLSNAGAKGPPEGWILVGAIFTHTVLVGLPIALIAKRNLAK